MTRETKAQLIERLALAHRLALELYDEQHEEVQSPKKRREICRRIVAATSKKRTAKS